jgi:hypothetical protein
VLPIDHTGELSTTLHGLDGRPFQTHRCTTPDTSPHRDAAVCGSSCSSHSSSPGNSTASWLHLLATSSAGSLRVCACGAVSVPSATTRLRRGSFIGWERATFMRSTSGVWPSGRLLWEIRRRRQSVAGCVPACSLSATDSLQNRGLESRHLESRLKAAARLALEVSAGWVIPSSRGLWGENALLLSPPGCWKPKP